MSPSRLTLALATAAFLAVAPAALAQPPGPDPFSAFDRDGNGSISPEEFAQQRAERMKARAEEGRPMQHAGDGPGFESLDANGDGKLTPDEMGGMRGPRMGPGPGPAPANGQGRGPGQHPPRFEEVDTNGDGRIDTDELAAMRSRHLTEMAEQGRPMKNAANIESFEQMDLNGDGGISAEEFGTHVQRDRERMSR